MYSHILVPVQFGSERDTEKALSVAKLMAGGNGNVTLLHVIESIPEYATSYLPEDYLAESRKAMVTELARMAEPMRNGSSVVIEGHSGRSILDWASKNDTDCIVLASHVPVAVDYLIGSTAAHVVRHAACSVHVVR